VPRPKSPAIAARDDEIYARWKTGRWTLADLGQEYGRSAQRIGQIIASRHPEYEDEQSRALHRGRLEVLITEIQGLFEAPGYKLAPNGRLAEDEDGNPLEDTGAKIEAAKVLLVALKSARELDGLDKPVRKVYQFERSEAEQAMWAAIEEKRREMAELAAKAVVPSRQVVRGEITG
jgi:hypothetical protein